jgi:ribosomal protein S18 acetylase RimI-like enzyme
VAENNNKIMGYIIGSLRKKYPNFNYNLTSSIGDAFVIKECQNKGIGKKLFDNLIKWFKSKKVERVGVSVNTKKKIGISAWKKYGFKEVVKQMTLDLK